MAIINSSQLSCRDLSCKINFYVEKCQKILSPRPHATRHFLLEVRNSTTMKTEDEETFSQKGFHHIPFQPITSHPGPCSVTPIFSERVTRSDCSPLLKIKAWNSETWDKKCLDYNESCPNEKKKQYFTTNFKHHN